MKHHGNHSTQGLIKGIGIGIALGCALGATGSNYVMTHKRSVRKNVNKALHTAGDWLNNVTGYF